MKSSVSSMTSAKEGLVAAKNIILLQLKKSGDRQTDRVTSSLLELLVAAKKCKINPEIGV